MCGDVIVATHMAKKQRETFSLENMVCELYLHLTMWAKPNLNQVAL